MDTFLIKQILVVRENTVDDAEKKTTCKWLIEFQSEIRKSKCINYHRLNGHNYRGIIDLGIKSK